MRWPPRRANFHAESAARASPLTHGAGKLEILGMFPPRTEAPTADKLTFCYAPHVDMATVIEVEVRRSVRSIAYLARRAPRETVCPPEYFSIISARALRATRSCEPLRSKLNEGGRFRHLRGLICERSSPTCYRNVLAAARIWVKVRKRMRQLPFHMADCAQRYGVFMYF